MTIFAELRLSLRIIDYFCEFAGMSLRFCGISCGFAECLCGLRMKMRVQKSQHGNCGMNAGYDLDLADIRDIILIPSADIAYSPGFDH